MLIDDQKTPVTSSPLTTVQGPAFLLIRILNRCLTSSTGVLTIRTFAWIYGNYGHTASALGLKIFVWTVFFS